MTLILDCRPERRPFQPLTVAALLVALALTIVPRLASTQDRLGTLDFPNSGSATAQPDFLRGVLLLHSFEFDDAAVAFREAQAIDPDFALAYWGEAMTYNHPLWYQQDREAALEVLERLGVTPEDRAAKADLKIEKDFLNAVEVLYGEGDRQERNVAYREAMRRMYEMYPGNQEAAAFYALSILGSSAEGRDFTIYMKAAAVASEVYAVNPDHPGAAHYIIHSFDDPVHAPLGLPAARKYSTIAPDASHALHMPSHIFVALGLWDDVAVMNVASWEAGVKRVQKNGLPIAQNQYHAILWECYARLQLGQYEQAKQLILRVAEHHKQSDARGIAYHLAMMRSAYLVEADPLDEDLLAINLNASRLSDRAAAAMYYSEALGAYSRDDYDSMLEYLELLVERRRMAAEKSENAEPAAVGRTRTDFVTTRVIEAELGALIAKHNGNTEAAISKLEEAAAMEDGLSYSFGPPAIVKPSAEALGEHLLDAGRSHEAVQAFQRSLARAPGRSLSLLGLSRSAELAGLEAKAKDAQERLYDNWKNADAKVSGRKK